MPIVKRSVSHSLAYGDPTLYKNSPSSQVLQNVNVSSMTGSLAQIGYLAAYASEIFEELINYANGLNEQIADISTRTGRLVSQLSSVESTISNSSATLVLGSAKLDRGDENPQLQFFLPSSKPVALKMRYESQDVSRMPPLHLVDPVLLPQTAADHGPCQAKFSNPQFFVNEWQREEEARLAKLEEEKAQRKKERRDRRNREKERKAKETEASLKRDKKKNLNWRDRLNVDDVGMARKESFRSVQSNDDLVERQARPLSRMREAPVPEQTPVQHAQPPAPSMGMRPSPPGVPPPSPSMPAPPSTAPLAPTPPPPNVPPSRTSVPHSSMPAPPPPGVPPPAPSANYTMPPPPAPPAAPMHGMPAPPSVPDAPYQTGAPPAPPMPPPMPAAPMPPPMPAAPLSPGGGLGGSLILSIQTGKKLRAVEPVEKKPDAQSDFLNAIRQGKALKKVEKQAAEPPKAASSSLGAFGGSAISNILERRKYLQNDDSEDSDEDDDDW